MRRLNPAHVRQAQAFARQPAIDYDPGSGPHGAAPGTERTKMPDHTPNPLDEAYAALLEPATAGLAHSRATALAALELRALREAFTAAFPPDEPAPAPGIRLPYRPDADGWITAEQDGLLLVSGAVDGAKIRFTGPGEGQIVVNAGATAKFIPRP